MEFIYADDTYADDIWHTPLERFHNAHETVNNYEKDYRKPIPPYETDMSVVCNNKAFSPICQKYTHNSPNVTYRNKTITTSFSNYLQLCIIKKM